MRKNECYEWIADSKLRTIATHDQKGGPNNHAITALKFASLASGPNTAIKIE